MRTAAVTYAERGWEILPLLPLGKECWTGETPRGFYDATCDLAVVRKWWTQDPSRNIGWRPPDDVVVLDVDPRKGGDQTMRELQLAYGPLAPTLTGLTGDHGEHLIFHALDPSLLRSPGRGIDLRTHGTGYVVIDPSIHPNGRPYAWRDPGAPIAWIPAWLEALCKKTSTYGTSRLAYAFDKCRLFPDDLRVLRGDRSALDRCDDDSEMLWRALWRLCHAGFSLHDVEVLARNPDYEALNARYVKSGRTYLARRYAEVQQRMEYVVATWAEQVDLIERAVDYVAHTGKWPGGRSGSNELVVLSLFAVRARKRRRKAPRPWLTYPAQMLQIDGNFATAKAVRDARDELIRNGWLVETAPAVGRVGKQYFMKVPDALMRSSDFLLYALNRDLADPVSWVDLVESFGADDAWGNDQNSKDGKAVLRVWISIATRCITPGSVSGRRGCACKGVITNALASCTPNQPVSARAPVYGRYVSTSEIVAETRLAPTTVRRHLKVLQRGGAIVGNTAGWRLTSLSMSSALASVGLARGTVGSGARARAVVMAKWSEQDAYEQRKRREYLDRLDDLARQRRLREARAEEHQTRRSVRRADDLEEY